MVKFDIGTKFAYHNKVYTVVRHIAGPTEQGQRTTVHHCVNIYDNSDKEQVSFHEVLKTPKGVEDWMGDGFISP